MTQSNAASSPIRARIGFWAGLFLFGVMLALPSPADLSTAGWNAAATGLLMAIWWMTEALPIPVTALLPLVAFPILGVVSMDAAASPYAHPLIFLFMGGFMIALAMERWDLHRRLALHVIRAVGTRPTRIVAGFMIAAAGLSMWISNTATAMMMLPIGMSVVDLVRRAEDEEEGGERSPFALTLLLGIAYACSVGGIGTLIGTPTNALLAGFLSDQYGVEISFVRWMALGLPLVVVGLAILYPVLVYWAAPIEIEELPGGRAFIRGALAELGEMSRPERIVASVFGTVALAWVTRPLIDNLVPGLTDAGIAMAGALVLFAWPLDREDGRFVLDWDTMTRLPWGVLLLFGGGLSLAGAVSDTGLATWIGERLEVLGSGPILGVVVGVVATVVLLTELTSNTATAAAFLPVLGALAIGIGENPMLLAIPATLAASCAFMLPVATPPNAIIYGSGEITIPQMARVGVVLNLLFIVLISVLAFVFVPVVFDVSVGVAPDWVR